MTEIEANRILTKINKCLEHQMKFNTFEWAKLIAYEWELKRRKYDQPNNLEWWVDSLLRRII